MFSYAFKKYIKGFPNFLPFIVISLIIELVTLKIFSLQSAGNELINAIQLGKDIDWNMAVSDPKFQGLAVTFFSVIAISLLISPILGNYISLIIKGILDKKEIKHIETLKESFKFYFPSIAVNLTIGLMLIGLVVVSVLVAVLIPFLGIIGAIAGFIFFIYLTVCYSTSVPYLLYYNSTISEALHYGKEVGRKYFWRIFGFMLLINIVSQIINLPDTTQILAFIIVTLLTISLNILSKTYFLTLCKGYKQPEVEYDYTYDNEDKENDNF